MDEGTVVAGAVLYRKWRPRRFDDLVGQEPIVRTLRNAVAQGKTAHAYLLSGPRGTGKTSTGRILAKAVNCASLEDGDPCGLCESCRAIDEGRALDLVEIDAASNRGIDNIRDLRERANYVPGTAMVKVYLIDEVHQLTDAAADALLKTLEEPPPHVLFVLATTDPESLKATILSRCQRFDFRRVGVPEMRVRLRQIAEAEGYTIPDEALDLIAREATGSLRDAVNLLDQAVSSYGSELRLEDTVATLGLSADSRAIDVARAALHKDLKGGIGALAAVQDDAVDIGRFTKQVVTHLRHALMLQSNATDGLALSQPELAELRGLVDGVEPATTVAALQAFGSADVQSDPYTSLPLELAMAEVALGKATPPQVLPAPAAAPPERRPRQNGGTGRGSGQSRGDRRPKQPASRAPAQRGASSAGPSSGRTAEKPDGVVPTPKHAAPPPKRRELSPEEEMLVAIRQGIKARGEGALAAWLNSSCRITEVGDKSLTLGFFPNYLKIHKGKGEEGSELVEAVASEVVGRPLTVHCTTADDAERTKHSALVEEAERLGAKVMGKPEG